MGLSKEQRRTEQLWWTRDLIDDLINEKCPEFSQKHLTDDLIRQHEPEILAALGAIADNIIEKAKDKIGFRIPSDFLIFQVEEQSTSTKGTNNDHDRIHSGNYQRPWHHQ